MRGYKEEEQPKIRATKWRDQNQSISGKSFKKLSENVTLKSGETLEYQKCFLKAEYGNNKYRISLEEKYVELLH